MSATGTTTIDTFGIGEYQTSLLVLKNFCGPAA